MTQTLLDPPSPPRARTPDRPVPAPARPRPRDPKWLLPAGIAVSALLHVLAFAIFHFSVPSYRNAIAAVRAERASVPAPGMQVVNVVPTNEAAEEPAAEPVEPAPEPAETRPVPSTVPTGPPTVVTAPPSATIDRRSLGERTRPRSDDPRLWSFSEPLVLPEPDEFDVALLPLYARLNAIADSVYAAGLAAEKALDWTVTDQNGGKWGFSPGKIHLGKITLPLPFGFSAPPGRREEYNGRIQGWNAIQRQAGQAAVHDAIEDRIRAIRQRNSAARDTSRGGGGR